MPGHGIAPNLGLLHLEGGTIQCFPAPEGGGQGHANAVRAVGLGPEGLHLGQQGHQLPLQLLGETLGRGRGRSGGVLRLPGVLPQMQILLRLPLQLRLPGLRRLGGSGGPAAGYHII